MGILEASATIVTILSGVGAATKWGRNLYKRIWHFLTRYRPKVPRETLSVIPQYRHNVWSLGSSKGEPGMSVVCRCYITNISEIDVFVCGVALRKPRTIGQISVRHPNQDIYGSYSVPPGCTTEATAYFLIEPPVCEEDEPLVVDIDFLDQFGNSHRVRKVTFQPPPKKKETRIAPQMETVSDINNSVEREVIAVLQAEISRYKDCGRGMGGAW
jgi:hypothetical protein